MDKQFTMSMYATKEELYKDKAEYYEDRCNEIGTYASDLGFRLQDAEQKLNKLIAELGALKEHRFNAGTILKENMQYFVSSDDLKALIDKYKGGE